MLKTKLVLALVLALLVAFGVVGTAALAVPTPTDTTALRNAVSVERIMKHERAFQDIADANGGTRVTGTRGYDRSAAYVKKQLKAAGYNVTVQEFTHPFFQEVGETTFSQTAPEAKSYSEETDFHIAAYSGRGELVDAPVVPTNDIIIPPDPTPSSNSGCEASEVANEPNDFVAASETEPQVALIQRGTCSFRQKADNAQAMGYDAAIIFNEGQDGRTDVIGGGLGGPGVDIPVLITSFAVGQELYNNNVPGTTVSISADTISETRTTSNVIADYPGGRTDRTLMVGAHLDSVPDGPGINDNGSGVAGILEIALQMKKLNIQPTNHVRFGFWGAEESSPPMWGSQAYLEELSPAEREDIARYLNFDMIGSPNYVRFVYDADVVTLPFEEDPPEGSGEIEDVFLEYFASQNLDIESIPFDSRSDYLSFFDEGIPAGGIISGDADKKTVDQAATYGGVPGLAYDPCYHQECDTLKDELQSPEVDQVEAAYGDAVIVGNVNTKALDEMSDAAAHATLTLAQTP